MRTVLIWMLSILSLFSSCSAIAEESVMQPACAVGDSISLGHYEQDNDLENGPEPIEWLVLDIQDDKALLISKYALDVQHYNLSFKDVLTFADVTWENCGLRAWLNTEFIDTAFDAEELSAVLLADVDNGSAQCPAWSRTGGNDTQDRVFLLSYTEVCTYYPTDAERMCAATEYAISKGAITAAAASYVNPLPTCWWWLRTLGSESHHAALVCTDGSIFHSDNAAIGIAVRPVIWVDLKAALFE